MKYKKHMIILLAAIFLFAMATASAADLNDTAVAVEDGQLTDEIIQASENQENTIQASVSATNVTVDTPTTITVTIPDNATGYVIITGNFTDNEIYVENSRFSSGVATVDVSGLAEGTYSVHIKYYGLDADPYSTVENDTTFKVSKVAATGIKVDAHDTDYGKAALIEVTVPNADMTGTIGLKLNDAVGTHITLSIYENKVTWNVTGLAAGKYTVYANYTGNYKYNVNDTLSKTFEVNKVKPSLTIDDAFTDALTSAEIIVHINKTATGSITIIVDGKPYTQPIKDGVANFTIDVLPAGDYDISAFYNPGEDKNYTGGFNTNSKGLHVTKVADYNIVLDVENITYGDVETVTVYINETGTVTLKLNGETYDAKDISGGKVVFPIEGLSAGNYTVEAIYIDPSGNVTSAKATFTVNKVNSTLTVNDIVFDYGSSGSTVVSLAGADGVNATVVGQPKAVVKVNGTNITVSDLDAGTYTLTVTTIADKNHNNITKNATITVNKVNATLTVNDVVLDYGESKNITVTTEGATGITAKIDGVNVTVSNYTIPISGLSAGNYTLTVTTIADENHNPVTKEANINVNKVESTLTVDDIVFDYGSEGSGDVSFTGASEVTANVVNQPSAVVSVSGNKISVSGLGAGTYTLNVTTVPDENHTAVTETAGITVNKINSTLTLDDVVLDYGETKNVTVTTTGATGIVAKIGESDAKVDGFVISIPALDAGTYTLTVTAIGDKNHNNVTKNATITVNKLKTELTGNAITTTYNVNKDLVITLKDITGKALSGVKVTVDLNGAKTYTTDSNGQVKVSTKGLAPKAYTAKVTFNGNTTYAKSTKDVKVTVKKATPKLTAKKKTFKSSVKTKKYTVVLKDNTGNVIKKAKVTLKVKGKTYKATTNSKGKATFKIKKLSKKGTFKAIVTYKGNKYYKKVTKKAKIKVIVTFKTVSKGSKDKATVREIQQALKNNGYYLTYDGHYLKIDGIYHGCTERSVKEFQHDKGLEVTGKVDEKTAKKLGII